MEVVLVGAVAFFASTLTLISGFGLGTVLMPAFALFLPLPMAIAATAVVHLANNLFKLGLLAKQASWSVVARFALPAALTAAVGAALLRSFADLPPVAEIVLFGIAWEVVWLKLIIGSIIVSFAVLELTPNSRTWLCRPGLSR